MTLIRQIRIRFFNRERCNSRRANFRLIRFIKSEEGTVESALVLIPLMFLFLSILQIAASSMAKTSAITIASSDSARSALLGSDSNSFAGSTLGTSSAATSLNNPTFTNQPQSQIFEEPILGGKLIHSKVQVYAPKLTPLLVGVDRYEGKGISLDEHP